MKKMLIVLVVLTLVLTGFAAQGSQDSIVICSMLDQERNEMLQEQLSEAFPGQEIIVTYMSTGKAAAKVFTEGENTEIDILLSMESGYLNKIQEYLADISGISTIPYLEEFAPAANHNKWITWEKFAGAFVINPQVLKKHGAEAPRTYADLLKPQYKDLLAMPDPKSSGTGYFFYKSWVNTWGIDQTLEYVDALYENMKQLTDSGNGPTKLLKQGEIGVGLGMTFQAMNEINNGQPLEIIFPETGSPYSLAGTAMIRGREQNPEVRAVFEFLANDFFVYDKEHYSPDTIYQGQINKVPNYPQNIVYADMNGIQDDQEKERLLALWKY